ncbi:LOW QUALITY PROTEIN: uncharacterized protein LOC119612833 [Lucilia sericata]|uniref:LOW QUALITY PROTEIN: uncharacterized protein LOC119612833 n=1 Tax=Lucilia sericata TaxID=13632 RepID=UPI0018A8707D|nr:LOW QUALITY PROTEIN: uncharacterized protein LOC119612833 [Lucilia sericata]
MPKSSDEDDLKELLVAWNLENILSHLIAENITIEIMEIMKISHIKSLLFKFPLGTQIRFEHKLAQWRHKKGKPLKNHFDSDRNLYIKELSKKAHSTAIQSKQTINSLNNDVNLTEQEEILTKCTQRNNNKTSQISLNNSTFNMDQEQSQCLIIAPDNYVEDTADTDKPTQVLIQTMWNGCKKFIKIFEPYLYQDFFLSACLAFNITNKNDFYIAINGCEILAEDFRNIILQYYNLLTFNIELKEKVVPVQLTKTKDLDNFQAASNSFVQSNTAYTFSHGSNTPNNMSTVQVIHNYLPSANDIRNIPTLLPIVKISDDGKMLENRHRATIAKAIVDECLNFQPERILKRQDFITLTRNLVCAFPNEVESTYFIPAQPNHNARGKLCNAYYNKRRLLASSGVLERRNKRKHQSDGESDRTDDKVYAVDNTLESIDFSLNSTLDWDTIKQKWRETHRKRRQELIKEKLQPHDYLNKYSILMSYRAIELMKIDVKIMHPKVLKINNWFSLYNKIVDKGRTLRKVEIMATILENIDNSNDEKYRASLALLIVPYIFLHNARHNEIRKGKATKYDVQQRFIKEYETLDALKSDIECAELQIRFVHCPPQITYAEFKICGQIFKCVDVLEALNLAFHYKIALNVEYPRMCLHIWQFIQLAIFRIKIEDCMQANVESTFNDLCRY